MDLHRAYELGLSLLAEHGLSAWSLEYDGAKRRAGVCRSDRRVIGLSAPLTRLHDEAEVRDTVLHEIAHALVGPSHGHDATWRRTALAIGSSGERCVSADAARVTGAWLGVCSAGHTADRHRRPERVLLCRSCADRPMVDRVFEWTHLGRPARMHPNFVHELDGLREGRRTVRLAVGREVRITAPGRYDGRVGRILGVGRTRYTVRLAEVTLTVLFAGVEPCAA